MTPERMNTMIEALRRKAMSFLMKYCPQKPAIIDTAMRYAAANILNHFRFYIIIFRRIVNYNLLIIVEDIPYGIGNLLRR